MEGVAVVVSAPAWIDLVVFAVISPVISGREVIHALLWFIDGVINVLLCDLADAALFGGVEVGSVVATAPVGVVVIQVAVVAVGVSR